MHLDLRGKNEKLEQIEVRQDLGNLSRLCGTIKKIIAIWKVTSDPKARESDLMQMTPLRIDLLFKV